MVGRDGVIGASAALDGKVALSRAVSPAKRYKVRGLQRLRPTIARHRLGVLRGHEPDTKARASSRSPSLTEVRSAGVSRQNTTKYGGCNVYGQPSLGTDLEYYEVSRLHERGYVLG
jgi:hypothetical protein